MKYHRLGQTGLLVSRICYGSLTMGPLQRNLSLDEGADLLVHAMELGINFVDTAEIYGTYAYIKEAMRRTQKEFIVASKSYSYTGKMMADSLEKARKELDKDVIDIFLLHEQESLLTVKGHWEAVEYLVKAKAQGKVKAIGLSTHLVKGVEAALNYPELEIIHPIYNYQGLGILDGSIDLMREKLKEAKRMGKGIYAMKPLGGGNLIADAKKAMTWVYNQEDIDAVAVGMQNKAEINTNVAWLLGQTVDAEDSKNLSKQARKLHIEDYCLGCGNCAKRCRHNALTIVNERAVVDPDKCILCGYCGGVCPDFAIKII